MTNYIFDNAAPQAGQRFTSLETLYVNESYWTKWPRKCCAVTLSVMTLLTARLPGKRG